MGTIHLLDSDTIDHIAAGEVVERPMSVVKELTENSIDAGATAITVEIREGGLSLIRVTDNGTGIARDDVRAAFMRHATSKMKDIADLFTLRTLGFRGEALSSISAVAEVDLITKTVKDISGIRYSVSGGEEKGSDEIGAPDGTTVVVRDLFFNTPARLKFLKTPRTEGTYVAELMEKLALSHPHISFNLIRDGKDVLTTSGNGDLKEVIYRIYGRDISDSLISAEARDVDNDITLRGFIGKPSINRANRVYETFFVNGRVVESKLLRTAVEEGYKPYLMPRRFPFFVLFIELSPESLDVNAHPAKREVRFHEKEALSSFLSSFISEKLKKNELIPEAREEKAEKKESAEKESVPEPFESGRVARPYEWQRMDKGAFVSGTPVRKKDETEKQTVAVPPVQKAKEPPVTPIIKQKNQVYVGEAKQLALFDDFLLDPERKSERKIIGQLFSTFWIVEFNDRMYLVDQHAAHEKVNYERMMKRFHERDMMSQLFNPPLIVTLTAAEEEVFLRYSDAFRDIGFMAENFGERTYAIRGVPLELYDAGNEKELFTTILDELSADPPKGTDPEIITDRIATLACKASVKGNTKMTFAEFEALLDELMTLDNPYNCPHGRPTIISMSHAEIDRKFKRIL